MCEFCKTLRVFGIFRSTSYSSFCMFLLEYQCLTVKKRLRTCKCKQNGTTGKRIIKSDSFKLQLCCHVYPYGLSSISRSSLANRLSSLISCEDNMDNSIGRRWKKHEEAYSGELEWKLLVEDWLNPSKSFSKRNSSSRLRRSSSSFLSRCSCSGAKICALDILIFNGCKNGNDLPRGHVDSDADAVPTWNEYINEYHKCMHLLHGLSSFARIFPAWSLQRAVPCAIKEVVPCSRPGFVFFLHHCIRQSASLSAKHDYHLLWCRKWSLTELCRGQSKGVASNQTPNCKRLPNANRPAWHQQALQSLGPSRTNSPHQPSNQNSLFSDLLIFIG